MVVLNRLLILIITLYAVTGVQVSDDDSELVMTMLITRHGARTPSVDLPEDAHFTKDKWKFPIGDLTHSGERQHYLEAIRHKKTYSGDGGTIADNYNPKEFYVASTDVNRTIMSAYSELLGYYSPGSLKDMDKSQTKQATLPFKFNGDSKIIKNLKNRPTENNFQPIPIHVGGLDEMMRGMDKDICPYQDQLRHKYSQTNEWSELNDKYQEILFPEMAENFGIDPAHLDFSASYPYVDNYYSVYFDQMEIENDLSAESKALIQEILRDGLYEYFFGLDLAVRLATTRFFSFLQDTFERKINATLGIQNSPEFYNDVKYMYLSAHDSTLTAFMSGLLQKQKIPAEFAAYINFELWKTKDAKNASDFYVVLKYVGNPLLIGGDGKENELACKDIKCDFPTVVNFLQSRLYEGDLAETCLHGPPAESSLWLWILLATAIFIVLVNIGYFTMRYFSKKSGREDPYAYAGLKNEKGSIAKDINKSQDTTPASSRFIDEEFD